ncbi:DLW-39 family protein [Demequina aurantiaca]
MKKLVFLGIAFVAGAVIYSWIADNTNRDLWDDVHRRI